MLIFLLHLNRGKNEVNTLKSWVNTLKSWKLSNLYTAICYESLIEKHLMFII